MVGWYRFAVDPVDGASDSPLYRGRWCFGCRSHRVEAYESYERSDGDASSSQTRQCREHSTRQSTINPPHIIIPFLGRHTLGLCRPLILVHIRPYSALSALKHRITESFMSAPHSTEDAPSPNASSGPTSGRVAGGIQCWGHRGASGMSLNLCLNKGQADRGGP